MESREGWKERAIKEHEELKERIKKLRVYLYDYSHVTELHERQLHAMESYEKALSERRIKENWDGNA